MVEISKVIVTSILIAIILLGFIGMMAEKENRVKGMYLISFVVSVIAVIVIEFIL